MSAPPYCARSLSQKPPLLNKLVTTFLILGQVNKGGKFPGIFFDPDH